MQLLDIRNLTIELQTSETAIRAVDRVSFSLKEGEVHALVGESCLLYTSPSPRD